MPNDLIFISAFTCEKVLKDQDDLISAIRIADVITFPLAHPVVSFFVVVLAKSSQSEPSERTMNVDVLEPDEGKKIGIGEDKVQFGSMHKGVPYGTTLILEFNLAVRRPGLHWITVNLDGEQIAKLPLTLLPATSKD